jgi:hypothetical protein
VLVVISSSVYTKTCALTLLKPMTKPQTKVAKNWIPRPSFSPMPWWCVRADGRRDVRRQWGNMTVMNVEASDFVMTDECGVG